MKIALRAVANGRFVVAEDVTLPDGIPGRPLIANREAVGAWEKFEVFLVADDGHLIPFPDPTLPPPVPPPSSAWLQCGAAPGVNLVRCVHEDIKPAHTPEGAFEVTKRVAWLLRGTGAGLLIKNGGENIVSWKGFSFSASRICYPDGHIFKVLSDVPATNGPSWQDNDFVDPSLYVQAIQPES